LSDFNRIRIRAFIRSSSPFRISAADAARLFSARFPNSSGRFGNLPVGEARRRTRAGFYIAGMKSYGRATTFLMLTGYSRIVTVPGNGHRAFNNAGGFVGLLMMGWTLDLRSAPLASRAAAL